MGVPLQPIKKKCLLSEHSGEPKKMFARKMGGLQSFTEQRPLSGKLIEWVTGKLSSLHV